MELVGKLDRIRLAKVTRNTWTRMQTDGARSNKVNNLICPCMHARSVQNSLSPGRSIGLYCQLFNVITCISRPNHHESSHSECLLRNSFCGCKTSVNVLCPCISSGRVKWMLRQINNKPKIKTECEFNKLWLFKNIQQSSKRRKKLIFPCSLRIGKLDWLACCD